MLPRLYLFVITVFTLVILSAGSVKAGENPNEKLNEKLLEPVGLEFAVGFNNIYQANVQGGLSTHRHRGRLSGSFDIELSADMQTLTGLPGQVYMLAESFYNDGIDPYSVGSFFGVNGDAGGDHCLEISELWYQFPIFAESLNLRVGKVDMTNSMEFAGFAAAFDGSNYANDEVTQFLNGAFINNPTIPFPDYSLGIMALYTPAENAYVSFGVSDAEPRRGQAGFNTAFNHETAYFYVTEAGYTYMFSSRNGELHGILRGGIWYDPQEKEKLHTAGTKRDDYGFYCNFDQMLYRETSEPDDEQGLACFARYGWANDEVSEIAQFWSLGLQYLGPMPSRDEDVLGFAFAEGLFSDRMPLAGNSEKACELYYSLALHEMLIISPDIQYIVNPGGNPDARDALAVGLRILVAF